MKICILVMILFVLGGDNVPVWFVLFLSMTNRSESELWLAMKLVDIVGIFFLLVFLCM